MKFEDGELIKEAYVVIDGKEYEVHMPEYSGNTPITAEALNKLQEEIFPVGSTYTTPNNTNPNTILGFGTWERLKGKLVVGLDEENENFNEIGKEGGEEEKQFKLPIGGANAIGNVENLAWNGGNYGVANGTVRAPNVYQLNGTPQATPYIYQPLLTSKENILNPYHVVGYMWIRTA